MEKHYGVSKWECCGGPTWHQHSVLPIQKRLVIFLPSSKHLKFHSVCFLLCLILWLCVVFFLESKATVSHSHFSATVSRPALPECGHLYNHASPCSYVQQKTENPRFMAVCPDFKSTGSSKSFTANVSSLLPFVLSPCDSHIFCSQIYYYCYCSSLDFIQVDFLQLIINVVCKGIDQYYFFI